MCGQPIIMKYIIVKKSNDRFVARATRQDEQNRKKIGEKKQLYVLGNRAEGDSPLIFSSFMAQAIIKTYFEDVANTLALQSA